VRLRIPTPKRQRGAVGFLLLAVVFIGAISALHAPAQTEPAATEALPHSSQA
jgi:hypothetical protein